MKEYSRFPAVLAYLPVIGWLYVYFSKRNNVLAIYHLKQSIGLILFLIATFVGWVVIAWLIAWIPYMVALSAALFAIVFAAYLYGFVATIMGVINALRYRMVPLPGFGRRAERLPIG
jgi:hypothetical protein